MAFDAKSKRTRQIAQLLTGKRQQPPATSSILPILPSALSQDAKSGFALGKRLTCFDANAARSRTGEDIDITHQRTLFEVLGKHPDIKPLFTQDIWEREVASIARLKSMARRVRGTPEAQGGTCMGDLRAYEWEDVAAAQSRAVIKLEIRHVVRERVVGVLQPRAIELSQGVGNTEPTGKIFRHRGCTGLSFTNRKGCGHEDRICEEEVDG